ncbi:unnamed protein product [Choristocarpus tenellus]
MILNFVTCLSGLGAMLGRVPFTRPLLPVVNPSLQLSLRRISCMSIPVAVESPEINDPFRPRPLLRRCIRDAPPESGVYVMETAEGQKLYIGKSVNLRSRVPSYFSGVSSEGEGAGDLTVHPAAKLSRRIAAMTTLVHRIEYIVTSSGGEALLLEAAMIKQHQPPFNVLLKDDKNNYPYLLVTWSEDYPRLLITRNKNAGNQGRSWEGQGKGRGGRAGRKGGERAADGKSRNRNGKDRYYGPFVDAGQLRSTLLLVKKVFPLRQRSRPVYAVSGLPGIGCSWLRRVWDYVVLM